MSSTAPAAASPRVSPASVPPASASSIFPPIPAPLQRLFDLVPLVTYPANALPDDAPPAGVDSSCEDDADDVLPTLYVFTSPADAARGLPSFNPTCLKWQTYLRLVGVPVRIAPSTNHASPTGALPFLLPARRQPGRLGQTSSPRPVTADQLPAYAKRGTGSQAQADRKHPRAPAYQALLDTRVRRAWLHAVYLHGTGAPDATIAARLYAQPASTSPVVQAALTRQLRTAAAAEVWAGPHTSGRGRRPHTNPEQDLEGSAAETAQVYGDAQAALQALATLLESEEGEGPFFFGSPEPTLFDAAVFSYTHPLLEEEDGDTVQFRWHDRTLPDAVRALPALVQHRTRILERCWPELLLQDEPKARPATQQSPETGGVGDSVHWIKV